MGSCFTWPAAQGFIQVYTGSMEEVQPVMVVTPIFSAFLVFFSCASRLPQPGVLLLVRIEA